MAHKCRITSAIGSEARGLGFVHVEINIKVSWVSEVVYLIESVVCV